jgi:virginiamycin B lyase
MRETRTLTAGIVVVTAAMWSMYGQEPKFPKKTGVQKPAVQHDIADLAPLATIPVQGDPDWMALTDDAVWIVVSSMNRVIRLDAATSRPGTIVTVAKPCSGLVVDFGSLWIPSCEDHTVVRVDEKTGAPQAIIAAGPADSEGGICSGAGSVWVVGSKESDLLRIDPTSNRVVAHIHLPPGSFNPIFSNDSIWVTSNTGGTLVRVNPHTNTVTSETPVGPMPRFLTVGAGSVWVLNQGDGTIARVDAETGKRIAVISAGIPGLGGEIAFGDGAAWATVFDFPITRIDAESNTVTAQWHGTGGDSIRVGHSSIWLTDLKGAKIWRLPVPSR